MPLAPADGSPQPSHDDLRMVRAMSGQAPGQARDALEARLRAHCTSPGDTCQACADEVGEFMKLADAYAAGAPELAALALATQALREIAMGAVNAGPLDPSVHADKALTAMRAARAASTTKENR